MCLTEEKKKNIELKTHHYSNKVECYERKLIKVSKMQIDVINEWTINGLGIPHALLERGKSTVYPHPWSNFFIT